MSDDLIKLLRYWGGEGYASPVKGTALGEYCLQAADRIAALEAQVLEEKEANRWAYVQAALDDKAPPIPTPEPAPALVGEYSLSPSAQAILNAAKIAPQWDTERDRLRPAPTPAQLLADALELPEVKALVEAADAVADAEEGYLDAVIRGDLLDALAAIAKLDGETK